MRYLILWILVFSVVSIFFVLKPLYSLLVFIVFSHEYFIFINYVFSLYKAKRSTKYKLYTIKEGDFACFNSYDLWVKISEVMAFKRFYTLIMKKQFTFTMILWVLFIIIFNLPIKVFNILKFLILNGTSLNSGLKLFYYSICIDVRDRRVEVLDKNVYLNGSTRNDIIALIKRCNPNRSLENYVNIYHDLVKANNAFSIKNSIIRKNTSLFRLGTLITEEGVKVKVPHWTNTSYWEVNGDSVYSAIHATSNIGTPLTLTQTKGIAMLELIKASSKASGSIMTTGTFLFEARDTDIRHIPSWQLEYVVYDIFGNGLNSTYTNEFIDRDNRIAEILGVDVEDSMISQFSSCKHDLVLSIDSNKSYKDILDEINNDF